MVKRRARSLFAVLPSLLALPGSASSAGCGKGANPSPLPLESEPYERARSQFATRLLQRAPAPLLRPEPLALGPEVATVDYRSGELTLKACVSRDTLDAGGERRPGVVFLHPGYALDARGWGLAARYHDAGFAIMAPMLRGENDLPGDHSALYDEVGDVLQATRAFRALPGVDPERIFVIGYGDGGTLAMLAALASSYYRAGASFSGSPDQRAFYAGWPLATTFDGHDPREFVLRSPIAFAAGFHCPFRLYFRDEEDVLLKPSRETARRARAAGLDVEAVSVGGVHAIALDREISQSIAFFQSKGGASPGDAGKPRP